jgi:hypothetical protein
MPPLELNTETAIVAGVQVADPFGVSGDPAMPILALALDPIAITRAFARCIARLSMLRGVWALRAIRVTRYKPGRRCVIEYDLSLHELPARDGAITLIGKVRAQRFGKSGLRLLQALWQAGFAEDSEDGISVPEPIGMVPQFRMWLQRKVPGQLATERLTAAGSQLLMQRVAQAAHKLHQAGVPTERRHTIDDEMAILRECLAKVVSTRPHWKGRIQRLLGACSRLAADAPSARLCPSHRDFYSDQVIVNGPRLYLIDFDLYCQADLGLDIGNFLAHITEYSLRCLGDPEALSDLEQSMEECFVRLTGSTTRRTVRVYATLSLVRHIYLSTLFLERRAFTDSLLDLCEQRLALANCNC